MKREIFEVHMTVVDANGTISIDPGNDYPKSVDSRSYDNDINKTLMRAMGLLGAAESAMSTQDSRKLQYAYIIRVSDGVQIEKRIFGKPENLDLPDPEPEPEQNGGE